MTKAVVRKQVLNNDASAEPRFSNRPYAIWKELFYIEQSEEITEFWGENSEKRAQEYADWMNSK